jgi:FkbM family methyltransferase
MSLKQTLAGLPLVRPLAIKALRLFKRDVSITNSWSGLPLKINTYHHKGYWYFGREREQDTMEFFSRLIRAGDAVIEVGGHIGFITQYFSKLVGPAGTVVVFEPGSNNLPYIEENVRGLANTRLERMAVSSTNGKATFFEDNVTGQNNSLLSDYRNAETVARSHGAKLVRAPREVDTVTLDSYVAEHGIAPAFLKIDVEGAELAVLQGARETLRRVRSAMVEVTENHRAVIDLLREAGLDLLDEHGRAVDVPTGDNVFAVRNAAAS